MLKRLLTFAIFTLILAAIFFISPVRFPISQIFPLRGIDVSHHQKRIDWETVAEHNIHFVWIKASEGGDHITF